MVNNLHDVLQEKCEICIVSDASQRYHKLCLTSDIEIQVSACFNDLFDSVNENHANMLCFDRVKLKTLIPIKSDNIYISK